MSSFGRMIRHESPMIVKLKKPKTRYQDLTSRQLYDVIGIEADQLRIINNGGSPFLYPSYLFSLDVAIQRDKSYIPDISILWSKDTDLFEVVDRYLSELKPDPDQLLRVSVGLGFKRARLKYVYSLLRGKDLETEQFSDEWRIQQFEVPKKAQERVINLQCLA